MEGRLPRALSQFRSRLSAAASQVKEKLQFLPFYIKVISAAVLFLLFLLLLYLSFSGEELLQEESKLLIDREALQKRAILKNYRLFIDTNAASEDVSGKLVEPENIDTSKVGNQLQDYFQESKVFKQDEKRLQIEINKLVE